MTNLNNLSGLHDKLKSSSRTCFASNSLCRSDFYRQCQPGIPGHERDRLVESFFVFLILNVYLHFDGFTRSDTRFWQADIEKIRIEPDYLEIKGVDNYTLDRRFLCFADIVCRQQKFIRHANNRGSRSLLRDDVCFNLVHHSPVEQIARYDSRRLVVLTPFSCGCENQFNFSAVTGSDKLLRNRSLCASSPRLDIYYSQGVTTFVNYKKLFGHFGILWNYSKVKTSLAYYCSPSVTRLTVVSWKRQEK